MARLGGSGQGGAFATSSPELLLTDQACATNVSVGDWVRWNGLTLVRAVANSLENSNACGLVEAKPTANTATIRVGGVSDSVFTGLDNSKRYHLSDITPGSMMAQGVNVPTLPGHIIQHLGKPIDQTRFLILIGDPIKRS